MDAPPPRGVKQGEELLGLPEDREMARLALGLLLITSAALVGCDPAKELPPDTPKSAQPGERPEQVPAASEPAAKSYVEKAVASYTGGKPELVAKGKFSRLHLKGKEVWPQTENWAEATRTIAAVWPDRLHFADELQHQGNLLRVEVWRHRPRIVVMIAGQEYTQSTPAELERIQATDSTGQHWMPLMLPLTDPKAIVYELKNQSGTDAEGRRVEMKTLKLALPELPVYQLTFDASTNALIRVDYVLIQGGAPSPRSWSMSDHKVGPEGLLLPAKMGERIGNAPKSEWAESKWEFPATIKDEEFSPPQNLPPKE
jgi:hypothetical protein